MLAGCSALPFFSKSPSDRFALFVDDYFSGTFSGRQGESAAQPFPGLIEQADSLRSEGAARALRELRSIDTAGFSTDNRIDWLQLEATLKREIRDGSLQRIRKNPGQYLTVGGIYWQMADERVPTAKEWSEILKTLENAPIALELGRKQLQQPPPLWILLAVNTAARYEEFLHRFFAQRAATHAPDSLKQRLLQVGKRSVKALADFRVFLRDTLRPGPENSWMVGKKYYDWLLKEVHLLPYTAEEMIEEGKRVHADTKEKLKAIARRVDPTRTWQELVDDMKTRHPEAYKITAAYKKESDRVRELIVSKNLIAIPEPETLLFVPTPPALRETYAWGGYGGITVRDSVPAGRFFVTDIVPEMKPGQVQEKLRAQNDGWVTVIALHEGYPGHHLQSLYTRRNPDKVRSRLGSTYYGEGWALFCEAWMAQAGFYQNADDSLAWLQMRLWRTARVIIDPSLHIGTMTYDQAVQFFVDEVGLERSAAEAEVNRYTTWPTQAPSYIIGWIEIEKLKRELELTMGARFREKDFVETVLSVGSLPLDLLKRAVRSRLGSE